MRRLLHFIDGQAVEPDSGQYFLNINPATEEILSEVAEGNAVDVDRAVRAAQQGFAVWSTTPVTARSRILHRIADLIDRDGDELARMESQDTGKPLSLSRSLDIPRAAANFRFFADYVKSLGTEAFQMDDGTLNYAVRHPVGVAGLISPWNLPLLLLTWKVAPCLAAGNSCVIKPAELTPTTAGRLAEICREAGLPNGVLNVVQGFGPHAAGSALTSHQDVRLLSLTGETSTGKEVMRAGASHLARVSLELGGKNPSIIFADADWDDMLATTLRSSFANQGEVCLCGSRIYVERSIYQRFVDDLAEKAQAMAVGDPFDEKTQVGALISAEHWERVDGYVRRAIDAGARLITGGGRPPGLSQGYFYQPTILVDVEPTCEIVREEVFGPVVSIQPFDTEEEVLGWATDTRYGLAATLWTSDLKRAHRVASRLQAGIVWVNTWFLRDLRTPFGGMKDSGIGREGGAHSFEFYSELSNVCIKS